MPEKPSSSNLLFEVPPTRIQQAKSLNTSLYWGHYAFTAEEVLETWRSGLIETTSFSFSHIPWSRKRHIQRVAFFCAQGWKSPPCLQITSQGLHFTEGQHRYLASLVLNHRIITLSIEGEDKHIKHWLGGLKSAVDPFYPPPAALGARDLPLPNHFFCT